MTSSAVFDDRDVFDFDLEDLYSKLMCFNIAACHSTSAFVNNGMRIIFPKKLHELLQQNIHPEIISWLPDGQSFKIHKQMEFETFILRTYFGGMKFRSFQRQLHLYAFTKLEKRVQLYEYKHIHFCRDDASKLSNIKRRTVKTEVKFVLS